MALVDVLNAQWLGNSVEQYIYAILIFVVVAGFLRLFKFIVIKRLKAVAKKTKTKWDDVFIDAVDEFNWPFFLLISIYWAISFLMLPVWVDKVFLVIMIFTAVLYGNKFLRVLIVEGSAVFQSRNGEPEAHDDSLIRVLAAVIQAFIWIAALLMVLANFGVNVTAALAGVGVGGIAIAFALQNVLADMFASFSIYFDKPFKVGDFIIVGQDMGTVEKIGIKSTRIRTLQGQELIVSNKELTETRVNNYKKMEKRRVVFTLGVTYDTPLTKLKKIPKMITETFKKVDNADLDRVHFKSYGDFSLNYEIVYYVNASDYNMYMDIQQNVNFDIKRRFEKEKIEFAFPTQTIHLEK